MKALIKSITHGESGTQFQFEVLDADGKPTGDRFIFVSKDKNDSRWTVDQAVFISIT